MGLPPGGEIGQELTDASPVKIPEVFSKAKFSLLKRRIFIKLTL